MATFSNILDCYVNSERHFRKGVRRYTNNIVKEFNKILDIDFKLKLLEIQTEDVIEIEATIGNVDYSFLLLIYFYPREERIKIYQLNNQDLGQIVELSMAMQPNEIALSIIQLIDPTDIVKYRIK